MDFNRDPFDTNSSLDAAATAAQNKQSSAAATEPSCVAAGLAAQDDQLRSLHSSLLAARHQTEHLNAELAAHNDLLQSLTGRMEGTQGAFEDASRRVRKLYEELTERRFTWTASVLIVFLTILLVYLILI